jgi:RNA methyltransferase, TrmH family
VNLTQSEIKYLRSLRQKKYRDAEQKFLLEGWRPLRDALESSFRIEMIVVLPAERSKADNASLLALAKERDIPIKEVKAIQLKQISDEEHSQGVVALVNQQTLSFDAMPLQSANLIVACDHISDPGNLGTILRTCDWFGADAVLLSKGSVSLYNEKVVRSTAGSIFHLQVAEDIDFNIELANLKSKGFKIIATTLNGKPLSNFIFPQKAVLLLGSEAHGVSPELIRQTDEILSIPSYGKAESLNVGIACGIFLAHWRNQLVK